MALFKILRGDSSRIDMDVTPFHDGYAYFTPDDGGFYIDAENGGKQQRIRINQTQQINATLRASAWKSGLQTITIDGLSKDSNGVIGIPQSITDTQLTALIAAKISVTGQSAGSLTLTCRGTIPTVDIPVVVTMFG